MIPDLEPYADYEELGLPVYKQFMENESFERFVGEMVFSLTSER
jgi:hypothetical protein